MATSKKGLVYYDRSHRYKLDSEWATGVTTALGVLDKPGLRKWAATSVAEFVADNRETVEGLYAMGRAPMVGALKETPWQKRDKAADRGTAFHAHAEAYLRGEELRINENDEQLPLVENAIQFLEDYDITPSMIEARVASRKHGYAGTADLFANDAIWDWKSGKRIYASCAFQLAAYAGADFAMDGDKEVPIPTVNAAYGVHIRSDGYDVYPLEFGPHVFDEFVTILNAFRLNKRAEGDWKTPGSGYVGIAEPPRKAIA